MYMSISTWMGARCFYWFWLHLCLAYYATNIKMTTIQTSVECWVNTLSALHPFHFPLLTPNNVYLPSKTSFCFPTREGISTPISPNNYGSSSRQTASISMTFSLLPECANRNTDTVSYHLKNNLLHFNPQDYFLIIARIFSQPPLYISNSVERN